jgi:hypothetical protein
LRRKHAQGQGARGGAHRRSLYGADEPYADDDQGELHRYVWKDGKPVRDTLLGRDNPRETWTWNIMPLPTALLGE